MANRPTPNQPEEADAAIEHALMRADSSTDAPDPLTPPDCDLRGLPFMPIDTVRLLDSDFVAIATAEEFKAGLILWCKAWQQVPAGSLPDDDRVLAHLSGAGARWRKVRDVALRNWLKCSDGRLYHPVVAEKALEALPRRQAFRDGKSADAERKERERADRKNLFEIIRATGVVLPWSTKTAELRTRVAALQSQPPDTTGHDQSVTGAVTGHGPVTVKRGRGTGTGTGTKIIIPSGERAGRGSRLPDDWSLPRDWRDWAAEDRNWTERVIGAEAAKFADYWHGKAGKDGVKADWLATWRNWCRRADEPRGGSPGGGEGYSIGGVRMNSPC